MQLFTSHHQQNDNVQSCSIYNNIAENQLKNKRNSPQQVHTYREFRLENPEDEEEGAAESIEDISTTARSLSWATTGLYLRPPSPCEDGKSLSSDASISPLPTIFLIDWIEKKNSTLGDSGEENGDGKRSEGGFGWLTRCANWWIFFEYSMVWRRIAKEDCQMFWIVVVSEMGC